MGGNSVYQALGMNMIWASRAVLILKGLGKASSGYTLIFLCYISQVSDCSRLSGGTHQLSSLGLLCLGLGYLVWCHLTHSTFFHWVVTSGSMFCGWEVKKLGSLSLVVVLLYMGNLLLALVHSAEKYALVAAEVPSGSDCRLQGTSEILLLLFLWFFLHNNSMIPRPWSCKTAFWVLERI